MTKLIGGTIGDTPIKNIGDGSAFSVGGGGAGWNGVPWDPKNDGLAISSASFPYNANGDAAWGSLTSGGVIIGITGEGNAADGEFYLKFPNAGRVDIGSHRGATVYDFTSGWLGHLWLPPGTTIGNTGYAQNVIVHKVEGSYADCLKMFPGLIDMSVYDVAGKLKHFQAGVGGHIPSSSQNPNGCIILYTSGPAYHSHFNETWGLEIRDSGGTPVTNGRIVFYSTYTYYSSTTEIGDNFRVPVPFKLDSTEQLFCYHKWGNQYAMAYAEDGFT